MEDDYWPDDDDWCEDDDKWALMTMKEPIVIHCMPFRKMEEDSYDAKRVLK
jgi:hypothetical protein